MASPERGISSTDGEKLLTKIKLVSEQIFAGTHAPDEGLDLDELKKKMDWQSPLWDWALGYLVGLGDVELIGNQGGVRLRRKWSLYPFVAKHEE